MKLHRIRTFLAHYRLARRYCNPLRAAWIGQAFVRALDGPPPPICADTGQPKHSGNCWNVRCQLGKTCCRADGVDLPAVPAGWKLTPHRPTREMIDAATEQWHRLGGPDDAWMAMWHAAPEPPAGVRGTVKGRE
jgi:hypothetical protein